MMPEETTMQKSASFESKNRYPGLIKVDCTLDDNRCNMFNNKEFKSCLQKDISQSLDVLFILSWTVKLIFLSYHLVYPAFD
jgi:hypothetical protein